MALRESGEDYLESIYVLSERQGIVRSIDVAEYLGVTKASVSKAMATLESNGYVEMGKRDVHLTERGLGSLAKCGTPLLSCGCSRSRCFSGCCVTRGLPHGALPE
ncbi:MAG: metal-dependent transcriptional regulator [Collinsella sp.]